MSLKSRLTGRSTRLEPLVQSDNRVLLEVYWPDSNERPIFKVANNLTPGELFSLSEALPRIVNEYEDDP